MKKNDLILLSSVALYSYLFYQQTAGINFLLFTLFLLGMLTFKNGIYKNLFNFAWWGAVVGSIASGICILLFGNTLSVIANILSLSLAAAFSVERNSSILFAGMYALYSHLGATVFMFIDWIRRQEKKENTTKGFRFIMLLIPFVIALIFFFLYREANPLFKNFTANIQFDFVTWSWIFFTILGFILLYGFFYHRPIEALVRKDLIAHNNLAAHNFSEEKNSLWGFNFDLANELTTGVILFSLLNILLFFVNLLDFQYVWLSSSLPEGLNFSESVHQGIGTLITSIVLAVFIILVFFRGNINFYKSGKTIKLLAYLWVLQNAFMVLSTVMRNQLYIQEYSLTYKRIGVYVYLLLCLIGLFTTLIKIASAKSNWYLFRINGWLFYSVLIVSAFFNWDRMITNFNLHNSKTLDQNYLIDRSSANTDQLLASPIGTIDADGSGWQLLNRVHAKMYNFLTFHTTKEWKSWNAADANVYNSIMVIQKAPDRTTLLLSSNNVQSLIPVASFGHINKLDLSSNNFHALEELSFFPQLQELNLSSNGIDSIQKIPSLKQLTSLDLSANLIHDFYTLRNLPKLNDLNISYNSYEKLTTLPVLSELISLNISGNKNGQLAVLRQFPKLQVLKMNSADKTVLASIPALQGLTELEIMDIDLHCSDEKAICALSELRGLKRLSISYNQIQNLYLIPHELFEVRKNAENLAAVLTKLPSSIEVLDISNNKISALDGIENLPLLTSLNISYNEIYRISKIEKCTTLKELSINRNRISDISSLSSLSTLQSLHIAYNNISDVKALKNLAQLKTLDLSGNQVSDLSPLSGLHHLSYLDLSGNSKINELHALQALTNLEELNITNCPVTDLSPLYVLKKLKTIHCYGIQSSKLDALKKALPGLNIVAENYGTEAVAVMPQ